MRDWETRRKSKQQRMEAIAPFMDGMVVDSDKAVDALQVLLRPGDRIGLEGDNQKQADFLARLAPAAGAHRAQRIPVVTPSHAPILEPVSDELRAVLAEVPERKLVATYVGISRARPARTSAEVLEDLAVSVSRTVRWRDAFGVVVELGAPFVLQLPPGRVLVGLAKSDLAATGVDGVDVRAMSEERLEDCAYRVRRASSN